MPRSLGLDIGGANLKAAHANGTARAVPFEVWRRPAELPQAITALLRAMPPCDRISVTMTAELCDCFSTKAEGVATVLDAVSQVVGALVPPAIFQVWLTDGRLVSLAEARAEPLKAAASNWLAFAAWAGRNCPSGGALAIDIGSTTSDIIPLQDGVPVPRGRTDPDRLATGELVYAGVGRTPLHALVRRVALQGRIYRVASELFATTRDLYLWLRELPEDPQNCDTADGRPATREHAAARLARLLCADRDMFDDRSISELAEQIAAAQVRELLEAVDQVQADRGQAETVVLAGSGEFLARRALAQLDPRPRLVSLREQLGPAISSAACAYALAILTEEQVSE